MEKVKTWKVVEMDLCRVEEMPRALLKLIGYSDPDFFLENNKGDIMAIIKYGDSAGKLSDKRFEFLWVGKTPKDIVKFMQDLAKRDGIDLNEVAKRIAGEDW